jgi:hypothetical protein
MRTINVNNIKGNFFGGLPYSVNWDFGVGSEPSRLVVNIVSENGNYATPDPNFSKLESIDIGNFRFQGYLVKYDFSKRPDQKTLQVEYLDKAVLLNQYFIGLNKKHGDKTQNTYKNLILVGKEYHPCDTNLNSKIDYTENQRQIDYCDPCPFMPEDKYDFSCDPLLSDFEIFPVYYTFNELLSKIPFSYKGITSPDKYSNFKSNHIGTLKNVLDSWCSDLGISYFWDPFSDILIFIPKNQSLRLPTISQIENNENVIDLVHGKTIENTFSRGVIASFEKAGSIEEYSCENITRESLKCLTLQDLYEENKPNPYNSLNTESSKLWGDIKELTVAISYLGQSSRLAFLWFWVFGNINPERVQEMIIQQSSSSEDDNNESKIMVPLGNMMIKDVYYLQSGDINRKDKFLQCRSLIADVERKRLDSEDAASGDYDQSNPSYYFIVAEVNENLATKQGQEDENLANNFLGKYWFKKFRAKIPGATNSNSQVQIEVPEGEGSAQWYPVDSDLTTISLFSLPYSEQSKIGKIVKEIDKNKKENEQEAIKNQNAAKSFKQTTETLRNYHSFILMDRNSKWFVPPGDPDSLQWYDKLFEWFKDHTPQAFGENNGRPKILERIYPDSRNNSNIKLFICRSVPEFKVDLKVVDEHPLEPKDRKQKEEEVQDILGNTTIRKYGKWGLNGNKAVEITLPSPNGIKFTCPVQSFGNNQFIQNSNGADVDGDEGFIAFVRSNATFPKVLPKIQYQYIETPNENQVAKLDFILKNIDENNLSLLNKNKCLITKASFQKYAKDFVQNCKYERKDAQNNIKFKMAGVFPDEYSIDQGLTSVNITIDDNGAYTNYSFEDKIIEPPSDEYIEAYLRDLYTTKANLAYLSPVNKNQFSNIKSAVGYVKQP